MEGDPVWSKRLWQRVNKLCPPVIWRSAPDAMPLPAAEINLTDWGDDVYPPSDDSFALVDALQGIVPGLLPTPPHLCMEIGCGSGYVTCSLALMLSHCNLTSQVVALDINPTAAEATRKTLQNHGIFNVDVLVADLLSSFSPPIFGNVDLLLFNPPYVPTPMEEVTRGGISSSWAGGPRGRFVIDRLLPLVESVLAPGGQFLLVVVNENDPESIVEQMQSHGLASRVILKRSADEELLHIIKTEKPLKMRKQLVLNLLAS